MVDLRNAERWQRRGEEKGRGGLRGESTGGSETGNRKMTMKEMQGGR